MECGFLCKNIFPKRMNAFVSVRSIKTSSQYRVNFTPHFTANSSAAMESPRACFRASTGRFIPAPRPAAIVPLSWHWSQEWRTLRPLIVLPVCQYYCVTAALLLFVCNRKWLLHYWQILLRTDPVDHFFSQPWNDQNRFTLVCQAIHLKYLTG